MSELKTPIGGGERLGPGGEGEDGAEARGQRPPPRGRVRAEAGRGLELRREVRGGAARRHAAARGRVPGQTRGRVEARPAVSGRASNEGPHEGEGLLSQRRPPLGYKTLC